VLDSPEKALAAAMETATIIAEKSPIAMHGTKINLNYARDHGVAEGLHFISVWQAANIQSEDVILAVQAAMTKTKPQFPRL
jgi:delta(3,5)-delta(2,4)-dienoyl-CoA isomerase